FLLSKTWRNRRESRTALKCGSFSTYSKRLGKGKKAGTRNPVCNSDRSVLGHLKINNLDCPLNGRIWHDFLESIGGQRPLPFPGEMKSITWRSFRRYTLKSLRSMVSTWDRGRNSVITTIDASAKSICSYRDIRVRMRGQCSERLNSSRTA